MSKLLLLFLTFVFGLVFVIIPQTEPRDWFLFSEMKLTLATHMYFICEKLVLIVLAYIIAAEERNYRRAVQIFFWLLVVDLVDYFLTYGSIWFKLGGFPVSMNTVKVIIFGIVISKEWYKSIGNQYFG